MSCATSSQECRIDLSLVLRKLVYPSHLPINGMHMDFLKSHQGWGTFIRATNTILQQYVKQEFDETVQSQPDFGGNLEGGRKGKRKARTIFKNPIIVWPIGIGSNQFKLLWQN